MRQENPAFAADYQNLYTREFRPLLTRAKESELLTNALKVAVATHGTQTRESGDPYYSHPFSVSQLMLTRDIEDETMLAAGVLHDVLEDTDYTEDSMRDMFGDEITNLVVGVTKLKSRELPEGHTKDEADKEELKRVFDNGDTDPRILVIKIFDRLHNMQTLEHVSPEKQQRKAKETLTYAELARRLGMWEVMTELYDLSIKYREPETYDAYRHAKELDPRLSQDFQQNAIQKIHEIIEPTGIEATVTPKELGIWELQKKNQDLLNQGMTPEGLSGIHDTVSFRVVVDSEDEVKEAVEALRVDFGPGKALRYFDEKDYITIPQPNGYSVFSFTCRTEDGQFLEIAVTTKAREEVNTKGIIAYLERDETPPQGLFKFTTLFPNDSLPRFLPHKMTAMEALYYLYPESAAHIKTLTANGRELKLTDTVPNLADIAPVYAQSSQLSRHKAVNIRNQDTYMALQAALKRHERENFRREGRRQLRQLLGNEFGVLDVLDLPDDVEELIRNDNDLGSQDRLAQKIGSDQFGSTIAKVRNKIKDARVTKETLRKSSLVIHGRNEALLLELFGIVSDLGGDVMREHSLVEDNLDQQFRTEIVIKWPKGSTLEQINENAQLLRLQVSTLLLGKQDMQLVEAY